MAGNKTRPAENISDREIVLARVFDAPRELVFAAFTDPRHVPHWWGPRGFTITTHEMDVRPGGTWRFIMHGPDGTNYDNKIVYGEITPSSRLVYTHSGASADEPGQFVTTATFEDQGGKTKLTLRAVFRSAEERDHVVKNYGAIEGGKQHLDRLGEHLRTMTAGTDADVAAREIVSTRVFPAPRERVFRAFSDPKHLVQWWGPKDFTNTFHEFDLRPGGKWRLVLHGPNGADYPNEKVFVEVVPPERIVFAHLEPMHGFQMTMLWAGQDDQTRLTWRMLFDSAADCARARSFILEANEQNFDRLAAHLATMT